MAHPRSRQLAAGAVALIAATALGLWAYQAYTQREARKAAIALIKNVAHGLRDALATASPGAAAVATDSVARFEAQATAAERNYSELKQLDAQLLGPLADAADDYLITGREILRRIAITSRARLNFGESAEALRSHMRSDRGSASWPREAVRLKERADHNYRDYRLAAAALATLLESFPASQARIAPYVEPALLIEPGAIASARAASQAVAVQLAADYRTLTDLEQHR